MNANNVGCAAIYDSLYRITSAAIHQQASLACGCRVKRWARAGEVGFRRTRLKA